MGVPLKRKCFGLRLAFSMLPRNHDSPLALCPVEYFHVAILVTVPPRGSAANRDDSGGGAETECWFATLRARSKLVHNFIRQLVPHKRIKPDPASSRALSFSRHLAHLSIRGQGTAGTLVVLQRDHWPILEVFEAFDSNRSHSITLTS